MITVALKMTRNTEKTNPICAKLEVTETVTLGLLRQC